MPLTSLGWASRIFELGTGHMDDVARTVANRTAVGVTAKSAKVGSAIDGARSTWEGVLGGLRAGGSGTDAAAGMQQIVKHLNSVRATSPGRVAGHVQGAANDATAIRDALRGAGAATPRVDAALEGTVWNFRHHLDEAWHELGMAKVMGELRR